MLSLDLRSVATTLAATPSDSLTMAVVARELGIAKPTLYRMAGSKAELVEKCLDAEAERLLGHLSEAGAGDELAALIARYADDSPGGFTLLFERRLDGALVRIRRIEARVSALLGCDEIQAASLLGGAAAAISRARA